VESPADLARALALTLKARSGYLGPTIVGAKRAVAPSPEPVVAVDSGPTWDQLREAALGCELCGLCETRNQVVFGEGSLQAELVFVGEAPGYHEDQQGRPFVGKAGELLTAMIERGMQMRREDVFIANVLKCRPPNNRNPAPDEVEMCRPYLLRQIELIGPKVVCALGGQALRALTGHEGGISRARGRPVPFGDAQLVPTFHPAYLLRNPAAKREAWADLKTVLRILGRDPGAR
jgi:DNA polymerase